MSATLMQRTRKIEPDKTSGYVRVRGARVHNLKDVDVVALVCVGNEII